MAHGLNSVLKRSPSTVGCKSEGKTGIGSRRIFAPHFKLQVLDSYRNDADCKGNQRATARKYGIHRRQIQKWLQCENSLRNSVGKGKTGEQAANPEARKCGIELALRSGAHRQRDDLCADAYSQSTGSTDARVPALSPIAYNEAPWQERNSPPTILGPTPLDYTTHSRSYASPSAASPELAPADPSAPIDLSFKRPISIAAGEASAPVCCLSSPHVPHRPNSPPRTASPSTAVSHVHHPDVWDLSIKGQKRKCEDLDHSNSNHSSFNYKTENLSPAPECKPKPVKLFKPYLDDLHDDSNNSESNALKPAEILPPCCSSYIPPLPDNETPYFNNNHIIADYSYTLHELQPKSSVDYYYLINNNVCPGPECETTPFCAYETTSLLQTVPKQRQSYSLDFKLSAIECYYQDSSCRGNQRAVANKYNIHRRQVQKWLKQEEELRQRNETAKQMHAVR